ncbi:single-stranded DNA-binding protein [Formosa haliotis]|uniref:single-stranded DNA-binding protein n=1 Tax=Formosa haliotis TaxID=1555194 RepID=UPI00350E52FA
MILISILCIKNHVQLIGNIVQNPIITNLENGKKVVLISLAMNAQYKYVKGEK